MSRPLIIDLFCCAGGAGVGYSRAGFSVIGIDIDEQPRYPFGFVQGDVMAGDWIPWARALGAAAIHASPPCQRYSDLAGRNGNGDDWPDLVDDVRTMLQSTGLPYVIENVEGAPLEDPTILCGTMFDGLRVIRHRGFETNWRLTAPAHPKHPLVFTHDKRKAHYGKLDQNASYVQVTGGGNCTVENKRAAMGTPWMTGAECNEAIPPAYTEHIGRQLMEHVDAATRRGAA
jgi:DNA (cytosine-5)-methyltransferase 1